MKKISKKPKIKKRDLQRQMNSYLDMKAELAVAKEVASLLDIKLDTSEECENILLNNFKDLKNNYDSIYCSTIQKR